MPARCLRGGGGAQRLPGAFFEVDDDERRARFARLLECEDVDLLEWFTRRSQPEDPELRAFVAELLDRVAQKG